MDSTRHRQQIPCGTIRIAAGGASFTVPDAAIPATGASPASIRLIIRPGEAAGIRFFCFTDGNRLSCRGTGAESKCPCPEAQAKRCRIDATIRTGIEGGEPEKEFVLHLSMRSGHENIGGLAKLLRQSTGAISTTLALSAGEPCFSFSPARNGNSLFPAVFSHAEPSRQGNPPTEGQLAEIRRLAEAAGMTAAETESFLAYTGSETAPTATRANVIIIRFSSLRQKWQAERSRHTA